MRDNVTARQTNTGRPFFYAKAEKQSLLLSKYLQLTYPRQSDTAMQKFLH